MQYLTLNVRPSNCCVVPYVALGQKCLETPVLCYCDCSSFLLIFLTNVQSGKQLRFYLHAPLTSGHASLNKLPVQFIGVTAGLLLL